MTNRQQSIDGHRKQVPKSGSGLETLRSHDRYAADIISLRVSSLGVFANGYNGAFASNSMSLIMINPASTTTIYVVCVSEARV